MPAVVYADIANQQPAPDYKHHLYANFPSTDDHEANGTVYYSEIQR